MPKNESWHAKIENVVYWGMDWLCPSYSGRLHDMIKKYWGHITPENTISDIIGRTQTGDLHVAVYDLTEMVMYASFYKPDY